MKLIKLLLLLVLFAAPIVAQEQITASQLPDAATNKGKVYRVTDALNYGQCTPGGGARRISCISDGINWVPVSTPLTASDLGLSTVATSGAYGDLSGKPTLSIVSSTGAYSDLTGKPSLAASATTDTTNPANITQSSSFRFTTDTEKSTWNAKENALTFSSPILRSVNTISCQVASGSLAGCLSISDWTNFNGKQAALGYTPLNPANNLSELTAATARTNLGLGTLATQSGTFSGTSSGTNTGDETTATIVSKLGLPVGVSISAVQAITIPDNGAGTNAAYTYTPSLAFNVLARFTCNDAQGCTITIAETNGFDNQSVVIVNAGTASVIVQDQATVSETSGNFTLGQHDVLSMRYSLDRYLEQGRSNN